MLSFSEEDSAKVETETKPGSKPTTKSYLVNVIDSPGHVDFFGEVSTALRLCDGCLILVDVIEGACSQTRAALQQAWLARVRPILVLNKIDRLFLERQLPPLDIYTHLVQTLEQVNAFVGELFAAEVLAKSGASVSTTAEETAETPKPSSEQSSAASNNNTCEQGRTKQQQQQIFYDWSSGLDDADDSSVYFSPENGNVLFASAIDGWGFTVADFAAVLSRSKLGLSEAVLKKTLWGDYYLNAKEKRIMKGAQAKAKKPLFVTLVLENLARIYASFTAPSSAAKAEKAAEMAKIAEQLGVKLTGRDLNHADPRTALTALFSQWTPLSGALLRAVTSVVPCPAELPVERVERMLLCSSGGNVRPFSSLPPETQALKGALLACQPSPPPLTSSSSETPSVPPLIVVVSKMFAFERRQLPQYRQRPLTAEEIARRREKLKEEKEKRLQQLQQGSPEEQSSTTKAEKEEEDDTANTSSNTVFIGFARVFSGTLRTGDLVYVLGPKHDPSRLTPAALETLATTTASLADLPADQHATRARVGALYLLMGRDLEAVEEVAAGHICGIGGLEGAVIKSATLSSTPYAVPLAEGDAGHPFSTTGGIPILRVAVEPKNPADMAALTRALKMLNQADACVDVKIQETGEHVIVATGEVHLERCIVDLVHFLRKNGDKEGDGEQEEEEVEFIVSEPIVPFRETIISPPKVDMLKESLAEQKIVLTSVNQKFASVLGGGDEKPASAAATSSSTTATTTAASASTSSPGLIELLTPNKKVAFHIRARPLPEAVISVLESSQKLLLEMMQFQRRKVLQNTPNTHRQLEEEQQNDYFSAEAQAAMQQLRTKLEASFKEAGEEGGGGGDAWPEDTVQRIWSIGPKFCGANLLINRLEDFQHQPCFLSKSGAEKELLEQKGKSGSSVDQRYQFENSFINGFQLCTQAGPLCDEPMMGVAFEVEQWKFVGGDGEGDNGATSTSTSTFDPFGPLSGQIMSTVKECCKRAFQAQPQRLMAAMFSCIIQINSDALGKCTSFFFLFFLFLCVFIRGECVNVVVTFYHK